MIGKYVVIIYDQLQISLSLYAALLIFFGTSFFMTFFLNYAPWFQLSNHISVLAYLKGQFLHQLYLFWTNYSLQILTRANDITLHDIFELPKPPSNRWLSKTEYASNERSWIDLVLENR